MRWPVQILLVALLLALLVALNLSLESAAGQTAGKRLPWTTSRVAGSPEPPHPYRLVPAFAKLKFNNPVHIEYETAAGRFFVCEQGGKIVSFPDRQDADRAEKAIDLATELTSWKPAGEIQGFEALYGLTFHPRFAQNRQCFVCYVLKGKKGALADGSRLSRFTVSKTDPPRLEPASEQVLLTFRAGGHNGGCLAFGPDGYLYVSTGDATDPNPPDGLNTGQDCSDLLSSILRIDVDRADPGRAYAIPKDNPFVELAAVRPEIWAFGFRNPWKMSFDRGRGDLWVGDVGWEMWEMVYKIKKGGNYGWSIKEGPQAIKPESQIGPTPILPATVAFPHTEAASITGGFVYRGKKHKELFGAYICGDWMSRKYWSIQMDGERVTAQTEIAQGNPKVISFAQDKNGELYILDYNESAGIYQFEANPDAGKPQPPFPRKLSETGLYADLASARPADGVYSYEIEALPWADHATTERLVGMPGTSAVAFHHEEQPIPETAWFKAKVFLPKNGVLAKTFTLEMERGNAASRRRIETQILHFDGREMRGYSYRWNDAQTDADLVHAAGAAVELAIKDAHSPGGVRQQTWHFSGRGECRQCHNPWAGEILGFTEAQLRRGTTDELKRLTDLGIVIWGKGRNNKKSTANSLVNPFDVKLDLASRARSYLHVNCAHCHQFGAGGSVMIDLRRTQTTKDTNSIDTKPAQGTFGIADARIVAPGDPYRSILYYRMAKQGRGRMPHILSDIVDEEGVRLIGAWIGQMPPACSESAELRSCCQSDPKWNPAERAAAIERLLASPAGALRLQEAWDAKRLPEFARPLVLTAALTKEPVVRDLFERFVPAGQKSSRLGSVVRAETLLAQKGDAARGREVFFKTKGLECATCHKANGQGGQVGPDLSDIGKRMTKRQILESLLDPSKDIDAKYSAYAIELDDMRQLSGLIVTKDDKSLTVRDATGRDVTVPLRNVMAQIPARKSIMPDHLLRDLTMQQAADLLAFLEALK